MKWIKLETNFFDSETCHILEEQMGYRGIIVYLRFLATIGKDIQSADDVEFAHIHGWTKTLKDWAHCCRSNTRCIKHMLQLLSNCGKCLIQFDDRNRCNVKFKNLREFVDYKALSSKFRKPINDDFDSILDTQLGPEDKIRGKCNSVVDSKGEKNDERRSLKPHRGGGKSRVQMSKEDHKELAKALLELDKSQKDERKINNE